MTNIIKKSVLCDLVSRHSAFNFDHYVASHTVDEYDIWNGFCLPMQYSDPADEYQAIRNSCALFDASPMKKIRITGKDASAFLDRILTSPVSQLTWMRAAYGLICNEQGFLIDDGIVYKFNNNDYLLLISELNLDSHFAKYNDFDNLSITEETSKFAGLAIQGPKSCAVLRQFGFTDIEHLAPFELKYYELMGQQILVGRVGFTGDLGYEIWFSPEAINEVEQAIINAENTLQLSLPGYGLSALQMCRIEAGMIVPGWDTAGTFTDLSKERLPFELTLGWNVKVDREEDFVGKQALQMAKVTGSRYKMKGTKINSKSTIAEGQELFAAVDNIEIQIGTIPSLVWHEREQQWIGFASIKDSCADIKNTYVIDKTTGKAIYCSLHQLPFINLAQRNQTPAPF
ncbi:aminomethyltransferase family protein [Thalassotalea nanhaiensis]|uniref:Aminomethyltransferase family protein n=1 Tax=Thalassotalea nanhaiensis TaxID=3065648 RepID=A0ABY9TJ53_9GAMM|nr:aminomethyltransferase family protein [Colwelliaceae bacterium SQ345]